MFVSSVSMCDDGVKFNVVGTQRTAFSMRDEIFHFEMLKIHEFILIFKDLSLIHI